MSDDTNRGTTMEELAKSPRVWIGVIVAVVAIAFIAQNRDAVTINLFSIRVTAAQWLTLSILFLAGCATGFLLRGRK